MDVPHPHIFSGKTCLLLAVKISLHWPFDRSLGLRQVAQLDLIFCSPDGKRRWILKVRKEYEIVLWEMSYEIVQFNSSFCMENEVSSHCLILQISQTRWSSPAVLRLFLFWGSDLVCFVCLLFNADKPGRGVILNWASNVNKPDCHSHFTLFLWSRYDVSGNEYLVGMRV